MKRSGHEKHGERYATVITDNRGNASCLRSSMRDREQLLFAACVDIDVDDASRNIAEYKKFAVVIFIQESEVEVIPSSWLVDKNGVKWHFSRSLNAVNKLIRKRNSPGEDWNTIPIRILGFSMFFISSRNLPQPAPPIPQSIPPTPQPVPPSPREGNTVITISAAALKFPNVAKEDLADKFDRVLATATDWDSGSRINKSQLTIWSALD
ncbi:hypothetical protein AVEN_164087-1 [Araneus ventricosus]|uniref:Uncharacterized protein n=1 Tax=Araneus ventricosus TaxID=182803 RepID=A0A4Y2JSJ6_ARAVE|nr:hypothetical protein AVEN_164087-1 [Araneus ventricosus]